MACISKLANAIAYDCDSGATGLVSALIINKADIKSFTVSSDGTAVTALTLTGASKPFKMDTVKRSVITSEALKVNDGAPNAYAHTVVITLTQKTAPVASAFSNGSFVIVTKDVYGSLQVLGLYYGLSATSYGRSSHDNGSWATVTLETPENVIGEDVMSMIPSLYGTLYDAAVG